MFYDTFDTNFGMMPNFDSGFSSPMFNGGGCFPIPMMDMGFNGGFNTPFNPGIGMSMPMSCGYSPAPFGCNPVSMDFSGNVCIDGIPITPNTPPAWMTARAMQAEMHLNQLETQMNDPNFWMNFIPRDACGSFFSPTVYPPFINWDAVPPSPDAMPVSFDAGLDSGFPMHVDPMNSMSMDSSGMSDIGLPGTSDPMGSTNTHRGEDVLPCGLTQSAYDRILAGYQKNLADCERQLENCDPYHSAQRAMIQNNIDRINRNIRDLDKPLGII